MTQESKDAEDIQATVAEEEKTVGRQTAETAVLKGVLHHFITDLGSIDKKGKDCTDRRDTREAHGPGLKSVAAN